MVKVNEGIDEGENFPLILVQRSFYLPGLPNKPPGLGAAAGAPNSPPAAGALITKQKQYTSVASL